MKHAFLFVIMIGLFTFVLSAKVVHDNKTVQATSNVIAVYKTFNEAHFSFSELHGNASVNSNGNSWGLSISRSYYLKNRYFVNAGLKYYSAKASVKVNPTINGFDKTYSFSEYLFEHDFFVMPIYFGKTLQPFRSSDRYLDIYSGFSFGIGQLAALGTHTTIQKSDVNSDLIGTTGPNNIYDLGVSKFHASFDLGFRLTPLKISNISLGVNASFDLTKTGAYNDYGSFQNQTQKLNEDYKFNVRNSYSIIMVHINYAFGRRWRQMLTNSSIL